MSAASRAAADAPAAGTAETGGAEPETSVVLIRHGESVGNATGAIHGHRSCGGLSELGRQQCGRLADRLRTTGELDGAVLVSSAFRRAGETAAIIGAVIGAETIELEGFGELDPGEECDGLLYSDFVERYGQPDWEALAADPTVPVLPGGESIAAFHQRVRQTIDELVVAHAGRLIAVATHGGVVDAAMRMVAGLPPRGRLALWTTNTSMTQITKTPSSWHFGADPEVWRLDRYNDAAHLKP